MRTTLLRLVRDTKANVAIIFALALPMVVGAAGLGVETTYWYYQRLQMQAAADAAAHAGAIEKRSGSTTSVVADVATVTATDNGVNPLIATITVNTPPLSGPSAGGDAVEVIIAANADRFFTKIFDSSAVSITTRAVARFTTASSACILALSPTAGNAANFSGNSTTTLDGCSVMSNSVANDAVNIQGSASLTTDCVIAAGNVSLTATYSLTQCANPIIAAPQVADPFADVPAPTISGACASTSGSTLNPGRYCSGLSLSGTKTLNPGVYIIEGSDLRINANAYVTGTGVTFYFSGNARLTMNGNSESHLSAPTSGTYSGILFFGDRNATGGRNTINGNNSSSLTGAAYFSAQRVDHNGNFSGTDGCLQVVGDTVEWSGSATVAADCTHLGMRTLPAYSLVQLSE